MYLLQMLQQSIKVSLITVSVEKLTYLDITGLKIFKFYDHPEISVGIEVMNLKVSVQTFTGPKMSTRERV